MCYLQIFLRKEESKKYFFRKKARCFYYRIKKEGMTKRRRFTKVMCTVFSVLLLSNTIFAAEYTDNSIEENETIIDSIYTNN